MTCDPTANQYHHGEPVWTITTAGNGTESVKKKKAKFRWTRRAVIVLASISIAGVLLGCCYALMAPFFPREAEMKGNTATQFGLVIGIYQLMVFLTAPVYGKLLSRHVRAKVMFCAGMIAEGVLCSIMGCMVYSPPGNTFFGLALFIRIIESLGFTAAVTCCYAIAPAEFPDHVEMCISLVETAFGLGLFMGPPIGGFLYEAGGFTLPFVTLGCTLIAFAVLMAVIFPETGKVQEGPPVTMKQLYDWRLLVNFLTVVSAFFTLGFNEGTLAVHLEQFKLSSGVTGLIFMISGGVYAACCLLLGRACKASRDPRRMCLLGSACALACFVIIGPLPFMGVAPSVPLVCVSQALLGVGIAAYYICAFVHSIKHAVGFKQLPDNMSTFGLLSGIFSSAFSLGLFLGPLIGGILLDHVGYQWGSLGIFSLQLAVTAMLLLTVACDPATRRLPAK